MPKASIVTCVKNEGRYLLEWIAWNRMIGFDDVAIYDNGSTDDTRTLLQPLEMAGFVRVHAAPDRDGVAPQISAFTDEVRRYGKNPLIPEYPHATVDQDRWVMFSDPDEFLVIKSGRTIGQFISLFADRPEVTQICFNWRLFGSGGQIEASDAPVIARFTSASKRDHFVNRHVKAISRAGAIEAPTIHAPAMKFGISVHDDGSPAELVDNGIASKVSHAHAYINHYIVKSRAEFDAKISRGRGSVAASAPNKMRSDPEGFWRGHNTNDEECLIAKSRLPALAGEMFRMGQWCDWWKPHTLQAAS